VSLAENALDYEVTDVEGEIPSQLRGVYYRNGPGTFEAGSEMYAHPFDGDGLELSLSFLEVLAEET
jgi:all-trans-8'-apo-beta-carotenal 15,15'-oxygenase